MTRKAILGLLRPARFKMSPRAYVSPEAADAARCDTESKTVSDDHGNVVELDRLTRGDSKNAILKWIQSLFGA